MERKPAKSFTDLIVWQKAHKLVLAIYRLSKNFPGNEIYGLTSQLRRAAVSVPANIAEGFGKRTDNDKVRFMSYSQSSLEECRYYLILADDLGYGQGRELLGQVEEVSKLLNACSKTVKS